MNITTINSVKFGDVCDAEEAKNRLLWWFNQGFDVTVNDVRDIIYDVACEEKPPYKNEDDEIGWHDLKPEDIIVKRTTEGYVLDLPTPVHFN